MIPSRSLPATFLRRALEYARATGIRFEPTARHAGYGELGLPDLRGFTPYRRAIRRFAGEVARFPRAADTPIDELETAELWLLHDLLHVVWYDFATLAAGHDEEAAQCPGSSAQFAWAQRNFFVEQHLASEAFAVLLLDYHVLSATRHRGLAVEVSDAGWATLGEALPELPPLRSRALVDELVRHYLTGRSRLFAPANSPGGEGSGGQAARHRVGVRSAGAAAAVAAWRDHEVRYSDKQRGYVLLWWDDLRRARPSNRAAVVERSSVAESIWHAIELFTVAPDEEFTRHVHDALAALRSIGESGDHLFAGLPKFRGEPAAEPDFRLTDVTALPIDSIAELVRTAEHPCAERLFLLWQTLALEPPATLKPAERAAVTSLAKSVQTPKVDRRAWKLVRELCERRVARARWSPDESLRGAFFLP